MKFLRFLWSWISFRSRTTIFSEKDLEKLEKEFDQLEHIDELHNKEVEKDNNELEEYSRLQIEKYKALSNCEGCEEEVFVLKIDNVEIGYYSSLSDLAIKNKLLPGSVRNYWRKNQTNPTHKFKGIYEIINYKDFKNENNNI